MPEKQAGRRPPDPEDGLDHPFTPPPAPRPAAHNAPMRYARRLLLAGVIGAVAARRALRTPYDLTGKAVLITGGSRGLGLALAREFLGRGASVTLMARDAAELGRARGRLAAANRVHTVAGDVTVDADVKRAVTEAVQTFGGLDVVVNNAGMIQSGPLANMTLQDMQEILDVNTLAPLRVTRAALPHLTERRGRVLIVASVAGKVGTPHLGPYSVSKFGAVGLGQVLRAELAPQGVGVTTVCPGLMRTGSPRQATIKGHARREYALFATLDNLPLVSLDAGVAARRIVDALVRGDAETMIGGLAHVLRGAQALAPQLNADLLGLLTRVLPPPAPHDRGVRGADAESALTQANPIKRAAERDHNELGGAAG